MLGRKLWKMTREKIVGSDKIQKNRITHIYFGLSKDQSSEHPSSTSLRMLGQKWCWAVPTSLTGVCSQWWSWCQPFTEPNHRGGGGQLLEMLWAAARLGHHGAGRDRTLSTAPHRAAAPTASHSSHFSRLWQWLNILLSTSFCAQPTGFSLRK